MTTLTRIKRSQRTQIFTELNYSSSSALGTLTRHFILRTTQILCLKDEETRADRPVPCLGSHSWEVGCTPRLVLPVTQVTMSTAWLTTCSGNSMASQDFTGQDLPGAATSPCPREQGDVSRGGSHVAIQTAQNPNCRTVHVASRGRILSSMPPCSQINKPLCAQTPPLDNCPGSLSALTPLPQPHPQTQFCSCFQGLSSAVGWRRDTECAQKER